MVFPGVKYTVILNESHLRWGTHRYTGTRPPIIGEAYFPIPRNFAHINCIYNSNYTNGRDIIGINLFNARSSDGFYNGVVKMQGNNQKGDIYAKNISENGNLKGFSQWLNRIGAQPGSTLTVEWVTENDIVFDII